MRIVLISILALVTCLNSCYGQDSKYRFAKDVFKYEYRKQNLERFDGKIERMNGDTFRYGDKVLIVYTKDESLMTIFSKGIFHPDIIGGKHTTKSLPKAQLDTMSASAQVFYNLSRNDSITIGNIEELNKLNPDLKTRRFVFWLYQKGMANPTECYFELRNEKGNKRMTMEEFIGNSKLTFFHRGTIIL